MESLLFLQDEEEDIKLWRELAIPSMTLHWASIGTENKSQAVSIFSLSLHFLLFF